MLNKEQGAQECDATDDAQSINCLVKKNKVVVKKTVAKKPPFVSAFKPLWRRKNFQRLATILNLFAFKTQQR